QRSPVRPRARAQHEASSPVRRSPSCLHVGAAVESGACRAVRSTLLCATYVRSLFYELESCARSVCASELRRAFIGKLSWTTRQPLLHRCESTGRLLRGLNLFPHLLQHDATSIRLVLVPKVINQRGNSL